MIIKGRKCKSKIDADRNRLQCFGNASAAVRFYDIPWGDTAVVPHDCLCSGDETARIPFTYISTSNVVELRFDVTGMNSTDDYTTLFFEGTWKFIRTPTCNLNLRMQGPSGEIILQHPPHSPQEVNRNKAFHFIDSL